MRRRSHLARVPRYDLEAVGRAVAELEHAQEQVRQEKLKNGGVIRSPATLRLFYAAEMVCHAWKRAPELAKEYSEGVTT